MQIVTYVEELQRQLAASAAAATPETGEIAGRLAAALEPAARLAILEALSEAAGEITRELAPGSVDVRLRGREIDFIVSRPETPSAAEEAASAAMNVLAPTTGAAASGTADEADDASTSRTTLRLPDALKLRAGAAAAAEGVSLNTWLVRAVSGALEPAPTAHVARSSSYTGWVR